MKKFFALSVIAAAIICACTSEKPTETYIPKNTVEFAGNAFSAFSLGADVKLYTVQNPENSSEWTIQAVVPIRKEVNASFDDLSIDIVPLDDKGIRLRDGLILSAEDLPNLLPVFNAGDNVERLIVFSIMDADKKYMSAKDATQLLENTKGVRMDFNSTLLSTTTEGDAGTESQATVDQTSTIQASTESTGSTAASTPKQYPMTLDGLCQKYGIYGLLAQYDRALRNDNGKRAKQIEDQLWGIEKRVKNDSSIPKSLRERFVDYIEDKEDEIEDRY